MRAVIGIRPDEETARTEATLAALARYTGETAEVLLIPRHVTGGAASLNWLMRNTDAPAVVLLESGCIPAPGWLAQLTAALESSPRSGLAGPSTNRAWNEQAVFAGAAGTHASIIEKGSEAEKRFGTTRRTLAPLYSLSDFCYAVRRDVFDAIGPADEGYGTGPIWEMDYNIRAARAGFDGVWVCAAYVWRAEPSPRRAAEEAASFEASRRRYQDHFCGARRAGQRVEYREHCRGDACSNFAPRTAPVRSDPALVSCIMPTHNRRPFIPAALRCFLDQDYPHRELIVVDDGTDPVEDLMPDDPRIRYIRLASRRTVGAKRNIACEEARGAIIVHCDDDDWYPPTRISRQVQALREQGADVCGSSVLHFTDRRRREAFLYRYLGHRPWVAGTTLVYKRELWQRNPFPDLQVGEDSAFLWNAPAVKLADLGDPSLCVAAIHRGNVSPKMTRGRGWTPVPLSRIDTLAATLAMQSTPLVSCVLLTYQRRAFLPLALACYETQTYPNRELIVLDDGQDPVEDLVRDLPGIRYLRVPRMSVGAKRNEGCAAARGEIVALWDDDDWYAPTRLERQVAPLLRAQADVTALPMRVALQLPQKSFWTASDPLHRAMFVLDVAAGTAVFPRSVWRKFARYPNTSLAEDAFFLRQVAARGLRVKRVDHEDLFVYVRHGKNTWQFETGRFLQPAGWSQLPRPEAFSPALLDAYAAAADAHARTARRTP